LAQFWGAFGISGGGGLPPPLGTPLNGLDAKCDEFGGKLFAFEKEGKEQEEYIPKFCCSLTCCIILEFPSEPETSVRR